MRESLKRHQARQIELVHDSVDRGVIPWTQEGLASSRRPPTAPMLRPASAPPPRHEPSVTDQRTTEPVKVARQTTGGLRATDSRPRSTLLDKAREFKEASSIPEDVLGNPELEELYHAKLYRQALEHVAAQQMQKICRKQQERR